MWYIKTYRFNTKNKLQKKRTCTLLFLAYKLRQWQFVAYSRFLILMRCTLLHVAEDIAHLIEVWRRRIRITYPHVVGLFVCAC